MSGPRLVPHDHDVVRVVRVGWEDPLDTSFSRHAPGSRWNTGAFPALYCCCSEAVARAVTRDRWKLAGVEQAIELQPAYRPRLVDISWSGKVVDVASQEELTASGLPTSYPDGVDKGTTQERAASWHGDGAAEGVLCRSASLHRLGISIWEGAHERWSELAVWVDRAARRPRLLRRRDDLDWLRPGARG